MPAEDQEDELIVRVSVPVFVHAPRKDRLDTEMVVGSEIERTEPDANDSDPSPLIETEPAPLVVRPANVILTPELIDTEEVAEK